jgi:predicted phosphodiesterase
VDCLVDADDPALPHIAPVAIRVGLISDTHGLLRPSVADIFSGVSLIVHAGDVGRASLLAALREIAPVEAV